MRQTAVAPVLPTRHEAWDASVDREDVPNGNGRGSVMPGGKGLMVERLEEKDYLSSAEESSTSLLQEFAWFDTVTRLPNRRRFEHELAGRLAYARRAKHEVALLFVDLDHFKVVNDTLGHAAGDELLRQIAQRLGSVLREYDFLARYGGDELVMLVSNPAEVADIAKIARKLVGQFEHVFDVHGQAVFSTASIGISVFPHDGADARALLQHADAAMYQAKAGGRNRFEFFSGVAGPDLDRQQVIAARLKLALEQGRLELRYQPEIDVHNPVIRDWEALLRWHDEELGEVRAEEFIAVAEREHLIGRLGQWVIDRACHDVAGWRRRGLDLARANVNISFRELVFGDLADTLDRALRRYGLRPLDLGIELTENMFIYANPRRLEGLRDLHDRGFRLSLDDFGRGVVSLGYLNRLPVDIIKLDQHLIGEVPGNPASCAMVSAAIGMGHSLGVRVLAEGVESRRQLRYVIEQGSDMVQGFALAGAQNPDEVTDRPSVGMTDLVAESLSVRSSELQRMPKWRH
jgi:diguanylate cyclase (GGDEF)-like protein